MSAAYTLALDYTPTIREIGRLKDFSFGK